MFAVRQEISSWLSWKENKERTNERTKGKGKKNNKRKAKASGTPII
jgi:hypothetical protein